MVLLDGQTTLVANEKQKCDAGVNCFRATEGLGEIRASIFGFAFWLARSCRVPVVGKLAPTVVFYEGFGNEPLPYFAQGECQMI